MESSKRNLFKKVQLARIRLQESNIKRTGKCDKGYNYYELNNILPKINEICNELNIYTHFEIVDNYAVLSIIDIDDSGSIEHKTKFIMPSVDKLAINNLGYAHTFYKRKLYIDAFEIPENDVVAKTVNEATEKTDVELIKLKLLCEIIDEDIKNKILGAYKVKRLEELTNNQMILSINGLIKRLKEKINVKTKTS